MIAITEIPGKIKALYAIVEDLESLFPGRHFTLDGHLMGSIGEVLASHYYNLELLPASAMTHDATSSDGKLVQIKATQRNLVGIRAEPEHLLVLGIDKHGNSHEIFNGPGKLAWEAAGKMQKNGQRTISRAKLSSLMLKVDLSDQLPRLQAE
ncbi:MAG: hypothetical protein PsegKO_24270 [Pseudohongiellaceae bacterium]